MKLSETSEYYLSKKLTLYIINLQIHNNKLSQKVGGSTYLPM